MSIHTLRPNGTNDAGDFDIGGGAATRHAALNDNSDATYVVKSSGSGANDDLLLDLEDVTAGMIPATAQVRSITPRYRVKDTGGASTEQAGNLRLDAVQDTIDSVAMTTSFATLTGAARTVMPDGGAIFGRKSGVYGGLGALNALLFEIEAEDSNIHHAESYLDVVVNEAPNSTRAPADVVTNATTTITSAREANFRDDDVGKPITGTGIPVGATIATVTPAIAPSRASSATLSAAATASATITATIGVLTWIVAPADPVTTTTKPTVTWTYTDPEGDVQERYQVKVFSAAQYGAGGFLPWGYTGPPGSSSVASEATWDSGEVLSNATSVQIPIDLVNGTTYRAYVRVADAGSSGRYNDGPSYGTTSLQTYKQFTVTLTAPGAPTLVATPQPTTARVKLDVTAAGGAPTTEYFIVERSDDAGVTWVYVRGGLALTNPASGTAMQTIYDYEAPRDTSLLYRARSVDQGTGQDIASSPTQAGPVTITDPNCETWLKSSSDSTLNVVVVHADTRFESRSSENIAVYEPEGRFYPIVHGGTIRAESFTALAFKFDTDAQWRAFEALRALQEPLLLQTVFGDDGLEQYWVRLGPDRSVVRISSDRMHVSMDRMVTVGAREVARPAVT